MSSGERDPSIDNDILEQQQDERASLRSVSRESEPEFIEDPVSQDPPKEPSFIEEEDIVDDIKEPSPVQSTEELKPEEVSEKTLSKPVPVMEEFKPVKTHIPVKQPKTEYDTIPNESGIDGLSAPLIVKNSKQVRETIVRTKDEKGRKIYSGGTIAFDDDSFLSKILFFHLNKIIDAGNKKPYDFDMLYELDDELLYADYKGFEEFFNKNKKKYEKDVIKSVFDYNKKYMWMGNVIFFFRYFLECSFPLLLKGFLNWFTVDKSNLDLSIGFIYATLITVFIILRSYCGLLSDYILEIANGRLKNQLRVRIILLTYSFISPFKDLDLL